MTSTVASIKTARTNTKEVVDQTRESYLAAMRWMFLARTLEDRLASLYRAGKIVGGVYVGRGQEAFSVALPMHLDAKRGDVYSPLIRDMAGRLAFGEPVLDPLRTYLGSVLGPMRGRDGNIHRGRPRQGVPAMISHLGAGISVINGMLMARRFQGRTGLVGAACIGDGGMSTGACHEALNQAAVEKLPLVIAVANNHYAYSTPNSRQFACASLADRAAGYGIRGYECDGTDLAACLATFEEAVQRARSGEGPQMVVGSLLRLSGHGEHDDASYIPGQLRGSRIGRDCLTVSEEYAGRRNWVCEAELEQWRSEASAKVEQALAKVAAEPAPDPTEESWYSLSTKHLCEGFPDE